MCGSKTRTMCLKKIIVFDVWSDYGHFRNYTTTSPLTYPIPPRTALTGLIAAFLGFDKHKTNYQQLFNKEECALALQLLNPVKKIRIAHNLIDTKMGLYLWQAKGQRAPTLYEYLKNPKYRLYVWVRDQLYEKLEELLKNHRSVYTPYFGTANCICNFKWIKTYDLNDVKQKEANGKKVYIESIVPLLEDYEIEVEEGRKYGRMRLPYLMSVDRVILKFLDFIYEEEGSPIAIKKGSYYEVADKTRIIPF
ncbi:MAG: type I-B CRISPR-associated protein Cas5b [Candidatus Bathyarchaeia archaeon]